MLRRVGGGIDPGRLVESARPAHRFVRIPSTAEPTTIWNQTVPEMAGTFPRFTGYGPVRTDPSV